MKTDTLTVEAIRTPDRLAIHCQFWAVFGTCHKVGAWPLLRPVAQGGPGRVAVNSAAIYAACLWTAADAEKYREPFIHVYGAAINLDWAKRKADGLIGFAKTIDDVANAFKSPSRVPVFPWVSRHVDRVGLRHQIGDQWAAPAMLHLLESPRREAMRLVRYVEKRHHEQQAIDVEAADVMRRILAA